MTKQRTTSRKRTGRVIGYVRASTGRQQLSPEHQRGELTAEAARRGWDLELVEDQGRSATTMDKREALAYALSVLSAGRADALVVTKLDRLARSIVDFGRIMEQAKTEGWSVVVLDMGVDTSTANGELIAGIIALLGQWEARMIAQRTTDALAVKRERGERVGRPRRLPPEVRTRIAAERAAGRSLQAIADRLAADGLPTAHGGVRWRASSVRAVLVSIEREGA